MTRVLEQIIIILPIGNSLFEEKITSFFARCSTVQDNKVHFSPSDSEFLPKISIEFQKVNPTPGLIPRRLRRDCHSCEGRNPVWIPNPSRGGQASSG
ncbi:hypothetical protein COY15_01080 [Candidatus Roizmanbacteria bacterium CG_4_10_14_0_2_um_filter_39_12]|nr:MAG: hypothetical protein COY15_01080 [Candidatus Roizmanbacteria bacterium CG_4_10_14_0_2_um_filter_39_12]